jgi:acyl dehydratase
MPPTLADLEKGHQFPATSFELTSDWVRDYTSAVGDDAIALAGPYVPLMALAALSIRSLLQQTPLPPGSIHVGQELTFTRPTTAGEKFHARAEVASKGERQGWILMGVAQFVFGERGDLVMEGRATITFPVDPDGATPYA